jgi:integrase
MHISRPDPHAACETGLRRSNIVNLLVSQLDFDSGRIVIDKTKNGEPIGVAMTSAVRETLREVIKSRKVISPYVFCDDRGRPYTPSKVAMAFKHGLWTRRSCKYQAA